MPHELPDDSADDFDIEKKSFKTSGRGSGGKPLEKEREGNYIPPGKAHVLVADVDMGEPSKNDPEGQEVMEISFEILALAPADEDEDGSEYVGKTFRHWLRRFNKDGEEVSAWRIFAYAFGLITKAQAESDKELEWDWGKAIGHQCFCLLEENTYNGKTNTRIAYNKVFHPRDEDVREQEFVADNEALAKGGYAKKAQTTPGHNAVAKARKKGLRGMM